MIEIDTVSNLISFIISSFFATIYSACFIVLLLQNVKKKVTFNRNFVVWWYDLRKLNIILHSFSSIKFWRRNKAAKNEILCDLGSTNHSFGCAENDCKQNAKMNGFEHFLNFNSYGVIYCINFKLMCLLINVLVYAYVWDGSFIISFELNLEGKFRYAHCHRKLG